MKIIVRLGAILLVLLMMVSALTACGNTDNALIETYWYSESDNIVIYFNKNKTVDLYAMQDETTYLAKVPGTYSIYEEGKIKITYSNSDPIEASYGVSNGKLIMENSNGTTALYIALDVKELKQAENSVTSPDDAGNDANSQTGISIEDFSEDPFKFVTLGEYKNAEIEEIDRTITQNELNVEIALFVYEKGLYTAVTDRAVKEGDLVNITFNAYVGNYLISSESAENTLAIVGNGNYLEGLEESLIGVMPGTERMPVYLKFPDDYSNTEVAGQDVRYAVTINYICEYTKEDLSDSTKTGFESYDALMDSFKAEISEYKELLAKYQKINAAWAHALETSTFTSMPAGAVENYYTSLLSYYTYNAIQYNMTVEAYAEQYLGVTAEELYSALSETADSTIKSQILVYAIAKAENIVLSDETYQTLGLEYAVDSGYQTLEDAEAEYGKEAIYLPILRDVVMAYLGETVTEIPKK